VHVVVAPSSIPGVTFESRMFAPIAGVAEDPVCGTAHTLSTPYWMVANSITKSNVVLAKSVLVGVTLGYCWVRWNERADSRSVLQRSCTFEAIKIYQL
jgi:predicted PhzF superfamily epimerase YddE/YHI9